MVSEKKSQTIFFLRELKRILQRRQCFGIEISSCMAHAKQMYLMGIRRFADYFYRGLLDLEKAIGGAFQDMW